MKILFFARHFTYLRNFESVLTALAERGDQVHVAVERDEAFGGREMLDLLMARYPQITTGWGPDRSDDRYAAATKVRLTLDYLRYLEPAYDETPKLRTRAEERVPRAMLALLRVPPFSGAAGRRRLASLLTAMERAVPIDPAIDAYIRQQSPDAVLITPLVGVVASPQLDYLYTAMALGIPTGLCVWSWDHLSSKALIRTVPDRVFVWNPTQRREAIELHGVPAAQVAVTGAQCFDRWFDRSPSRTREAFCRHVGLPDDKPFLLWVCSALFRGSPVEAEFVTRWIAELRQSGHPALRDVNILVRPHPSRLKEWEQVDLSALPRVALWGGNPVDVDSRNDYFDSLHYSIGVAGLNTSAFIEGAIAGRPVYTILLPEFHENQEGTIHFHYLLNVAGGLLHQARSFEEHSAQLASLLASPSAPSERSRAFVEAFVRPQGLTESSTRRFVDGLIELASLRPVPFSHTAPAAARMLVTRLARFSAGAGRTWMMSARERLEYDNSRTVRVRKDADRRVRMDAKAQVRADKASRVEQRERDKRRRTKAQERGRFKKDVLRRLRIG